MGSCTQKGLDAGPAVPYLQQEYGQHQYLEQYWGCSQPWTKYRQDQQVNQQRQDQQVEHQNQEPERLLSPGLQSN